MRSTIFDDKTVRDNFELREIPEAMKAEAAEWRAKLIEEVAATDDALMEKFFEDPDSITPDELLAAIRKATISMQIVPMLCGSSFHNKGVQKLLDYVMAFLPSPLDVPAVTGMNPKTEQEEIRHASEEDPFCGTASRSPRNASLGRLAFVAFTRAKPMPVRTCSTHAAAARAYQPHLPDAPTKQRPDGDRQLQRHLRSRRFQEIRRRHALRREHSMVLEQMTFPEPVISPAVEPKTQKDLDKLGIARWRSWPKRTPPSRCTPTRIRVRR